MAISTPRDQNRVTTLLGTLNSDGVTVVSIQANTTYNALKVQNAANGGDQPYVNSQRDSNRVPAVWALSSVDGVTPVPVYADSSGNLLVDNT